MSQADHQHGDSDDNGMVGDCRLMLRYARKNGLSLPDQLKQDITALDGLLKQCRLRPVSDVSAALIAAAGPLDIGEDGKPLPPDVHAQAEMLVLNVHGQLSQAVAPATALTLQVSEPPPGRHRLFGGVPLLVKTAAMVAFASAIIFMFDVALQAKSAGFGALFVSFLAGVNMLSGGALGASFYVLVRSQPYLKNRSYDPKYNAVYISRFITGVIAGVILAYLTGPTLSAQLSQLGGGAAFTPGLIAMLGGYAAEAVELVLQRFVDVLLTAVRGDGSAQAKARAAQEHSAKVARIEDATGEILDAPDMQQAKAAVLKLRSSLRG